MACTPLPIVPCLPFFPLEWKNTHGDQQMTCEWEMSKCTSNRGKISALKIFQSVGWRYRRTVSSGDHVVTFCWIKVIEKCAFAQLDYIPCVGYYGIFSSACTVNIPNLSIPTCKMLRKIAFSGGWHAVCPCTIMIVVMWCWINAYLWHLSTNYPLPGQVKGFRTSVWTTNQYEFYCSVARTLHSDVL